MRRRSGGGVVEGGPFWMSFEGRDGGLRNIFPQAQHFDPYLAYRWL